MKVEKTLTIDEIYEETKNYDIVLTAEAHLAEALNNRIQTPQISKLAYTPKTLIYKEFQNRELKAEKELFIEIIRNTDLSWKEASYLLRRIIDIWMETGSLQEARNHLEENEEKIEDIIEILNDTTNLYSEMERTVIAEEKDVCVIGLYQFSSLDKSVLPEKFDTLGIFKDESYGLPPFRVFSSANQLVGSVLDNIKRIGEENAAAVVHPDSIYNSLLSSYLREASVDFQVREKLQYLDSFRRLISFFNFSLQADVLKLKEIRPLLKDFPIKPSKRKDEEYLAKIDDSEVKDFFGLIKDSAKKDFGEIVNRLNAEGFAVDEGVEDALKQLDMWKKPLTATNLNDLKYFLDSFPLEKEKKTRGLLVVNPGAVAYIDRPVVFYLGMTTKWDKNVTERPWRNNDRARERNITNFKALIQNGRQQHYMVLNKEMNLEVTPTSYFNEIEPGLASFSAGEEGEDYKYYERTSKKGISFSSDHVNKEPGEVKTLSQSSLKKLIYCPRDYFFSRLVKEPDKNYLRRGNLFHDFAEFYVNFPDFVEEKGLSQFVESMMERIESIEDRFMLSKLRTEYRLGLKKIVEFCRENNLTSLSSVDRNGYRPSEQENFFARKYDRKLERKFTEMNFKNEKIGAEGKVDLLTREEILNHKTSSKDSVSSIVKSYVVDKFEGKPNLQALMYISNHREVVGDRNIQFTFFYVLEDIGKVLDGDNPLSGSSSKISYYPCSFKEFLGREEAYNYACKSEKRRKLLRPLGKERFGQFFSGLEFDPEDFLSKDTAVKYRKELEVFCRNRLVVGKGKDDYDLTKNQLEKASESILKTSVYELRTSRYFKDDVDKFERLLEVSIEDLNRWRKKRFPIHNRFQKEDGDCDEANHRDLILTGDGVW